MKMKKMIAGFMAVMMACAAGVGCTPTKVGSNKSSDGKISISIGGQPVEKTEKMQQDMICSKKI